MVELIDNFFGSIAWDIREPPAQICVYTHKPATGNGSVYTTPPQIVNIFSDKAPKEVKDALEAKLPLVPKKINIPILPYRDTYTIDSNFTEQITVKTLLEAIYNVYQKEICPEDITNILASCEADINSHKCLKDHLDELKLSNTKVRLHDFLLTNSGRSYTKFIHLEYSTNEWELFLTIF